MNTFTNLIFFTNQLLTIYYYKMKNLLMSKNSLFAAANITLSKNQMLLVKGGSESEFDNPHGGPTGPVTMPPIVPGNGDKPAGQ